MTEPKQSFTEEIQKEAAERYKPFYNQSSYDENALRRSTFIEGANVALSILSRGGEGREFWLSEEYETVTGVYPSEAEALKNAWCNDPENVTHVIEHSALVAERAKLEFMNQNCISLGLHESRVQRLESEITTLRARADAFTELSNKLAAQLKLCKEQRNSASAVHWANCDYLTPQESQDGHEKEIAMFDDELQKKGQGDEK